MKTVLIASCWLAVAGAATAADYADLPPRAAVERAIADYPAVRAAQAGIRAEEANRARLVAGTHEFNVRVGAQRRAVDDPNQRFHEWDVGLERALRLPGKARIDAELGAQGVDRATLAYGDAMHEAARTLLKNWFAWQRERAQAQQWQQQVQVLQAQLAATNKRVRAGDASRLDASLAEAALAQAEAAAEQATGRARSAASDLSLRFNGIALPQQVALAEPQPLTQGEEYWRQQVLQHNHELALARAEVMRGQLTTARASADRLPDPAVGIRFASERSGTEHVVGVSVAIPLPGQGRAAAASAAQAEAEAAASREAGVLRRLEAETASAFITAQSTLGNWQRLQRAGQRVANNAELMARAYALGETGLADVLAARRLAIEAQLAAATAQLDASETRYRLLLDAHQLWTLGEEHDAAAAAAAPM